MAASLLLHGDFVQRPAIPAHARCGETDDVLMASSKTNMQTTVFQASKEFVAT
jgi:hypothetical protein